MFSSLIFKGSKGANRKAFTLIELVIVIVILGILAGVAALSFRDLNKSTKNGVAKANLRAIKSAAQVFQVDNQGKLPSSLFVLKKYLDNDLQKAIGLDKLSTATNPGKVDGYIYSLLVDKSTNPNSITLTCVSDDHPQSLTGKESANDGSFYKLTGPIK